MANTDGIFKFMDPAIIAFPESIFKPKAFMKDGKAVGEEKYEGNLLFKDADELKAMKKHAVAVAKAKWGNVDLKSIKFPFRSGDKAADKRKMEIAGGAKKPDGEFQRGKVTIVAKSKFQPQLSAVEGDRIVEYTDATMAVAKAKFFFGAEVIGELNFVAVEVSGNKSVAVYLNALMATGKGTKIGGRQAAADRFKGYRGTVSAEDPTGGELEDELAGL